MPPPSKTLNMEESEEEIKPEIPPSSSSPPPPSTTTIEPSSQPQPPSSKRIFASPVARRLATEHNISLDQINGTGPKNRITKADIENYITSGGADKQQRQPIVKQPP